MKYISVLLATLVLTACGGGSSSTDSNNPGEPVSTENIVINDTNITSGQSVELILKNTSGAVSSILWQQLSGASVELLSSNSKVIAFTVPSAGDYDFEVQYMLDGISKVETVSFSAESGDPALIARLGHSTIEGNGVSLRAFYQNNVEQSSITWKQLTGPNVTFDSDNISKELLIFAAPLVNSDVIITIQVSGVDLSGNTLTDTVSILVENAPAIASGAYFDDDVLAKVYPYNRNSPYKDDLVNCVYSNQLTSSCKLSALPLIANEVSNGTPTIEQIMDRVVVSHDWMGMRFKEYLQAFDDHDDFKNLLRASTAIVLSYDIRPSFYWAATGAIYLDPNNLWLTPAERDTINEAPDYRANFGSDLKFVMPWRYVKDNDYVSFYYPPESRLTRELFDIKYELADLLYHELAHANDYVPAAEWYTYNSNSRFYDAAISQDEISTDLVSLYPLTSQIMKDLASVRFLGDTANALQKSYTPNDVAGFYSQDISNGFYNYTNPKEDLGIVFESLMMSIRFGVQRDTAVTNDADSGYIVSWGQRGRIGKPGINDRAYYIASRLLPEFDLELVATLPQPQQMTPGLDWWDNLELNPSIPAPLLTAPAQLQQASSFEFTTSGKRRPKIQTERPHGRALPNH